nr:ribosomal protein S8 [Entransia fimbriata]WKT05900.1 ribosomal protein S8 [Entransia fimbriata]
MHHDTISAILVGIKNASLRKKHIVRLPYNSMTSKIAKILQEEGLINHWKESINKEGRKSIYITLQYQTKKKISAITDLKRASKLGVRLYVNYTDIPQILGGLGISILSTSQGIMSDKQAKKQGLGGEILCYIW